jgi:hypothetical protein
MNFDDIPTIEGAGRLGRRPEVDSAVAEAYITRVEPPAALSSLGFALGLRAVELLRDRMFPRGDDLVALGGAMAGPNYTMYTDCAGYNYAGTCNEACFGFQPEHMDPFYCATCEEQAADPINNPSYNWHFTGSRGSIQYIDREPDICGSPARDAWKWEVGPCGQCQTSAIFRCHDGYKLYPNAASWTPTICQGIVSCDNQLTLCD